jgi:hypothetical protein
VRLEFRHQARRTSRHRWLFRVGWRHLDVRWAWGLPWEQHLARPVNAWGKRTLDGWLSYLDVHRFHLRIQFHHQKKATPAHAIHAR